MWPSCASVSSSCSTITSPVASAAIAACAVQCVVEPESTGIGGDCFCLYAPAGSAESIVAFNGSGRAPDGLSSESLLAEGITRIERHSAHAVTVPGAVDAWVQLNRDHGSMPLDRLLLPAIGYARDGYPITQRVARLGILHPDQRNDVACLRAIELLSLISMHLNDTTDALAFAGVGI